MSGIRYGEGMTLADIAALDASDPLAFTRARFRLPEGVIYLDGNSLGALPASTPGRIAEVVEREWGQDLIGSWNSAGWMDLPYKIGGRIAALVGADKDEVVAGDSTSVCLYKLAAAATTLRPERRVVLSEPGNFPTNLYVLQGLCAERGLDLRVEPPETIAEALTDEVALLALTHAHYKSGRLHDMAALTAKAHAVGALALWDLCHSAGAMPVDLNGAGADFAVGCGYKYLNGGPGAPGYMMAAKRYQAVARQPLTGWIGHAAPFDFQDDYAPGKGMKRMLTGTPAVLGLVALEEGLKTFEGVDMAEVRAKSMRLSEVFLGEVERRLPGVFALACSREAAARGSQVSLSHPEGYAIMQALIAAGVVGDFRAPDVLRFGFTPLYLRYADAVEAAARVQQVMESGVWRQPRFSQRQAVT